ncbi:hypothetical protein PCE1_002747 [Barthelona sp. PCE]
MSKEQIDQHEKLDLQHEEIKWQQDELKTMRSVFISFFNKVTPVTLFHSLSELFEENLWFGERVFCTEFRKAILMNGLSTPTFAALFSVVNCVLPDLGKRFLEVLIMDFQNFYAMMHTYCLNILRFLCHCMNQNVINELFIVECAYFLLDVVQGGGAHPLPIDLIHEIFFSSGERLKHTQPEFYKSFFLEIKDNMIFQSLYSGFQKNFESHPALLPEHNLIHSKGQNMHEFEFFNTISTDFLIKIDEISLFPNLDESCEKWEAFISATFARNDTFNTMSFVKKIKKEEKIINQDQLTNDVYFAMRSAISPNELIQKVLHLKAANRVRDEFIFCNCVLSAALKWKIIGDDVKNLLLFLSRSGSRGYQDFTTAMKLKFIGYFKDSNKLKLSDTNKIIEIYVHLLRNGIFSRELLEPLHVSSNMEDSGMRNFVYQLFLKWKGDTTFATFAKSIEHLMPLPELFPTVEDQNYELLSGFWSGHRDKRSMELSDVFRLLSKKRQQSDMMGRKSQYREHMESSYR